MKRTVIALQERVHTECMQFIYNQIFADYRKRDGE